MNITHGPHGVAYVLDLATARIVEFSEQETPDYELHPDSPQAQLGAQRYYRSRSAMAGGFRVPPAPYRWRVGSLKTLHAGRGDNLAAPVEGEGGKYLVVLDGGDDEQLAAVQVDPNGYDAIVRRSTALRTHSGEIVVPDWVRNWILGEDFGVEEDDLKHVLRDRWMRHVHVQQGREWHGYGRYSRRRLLELLLEPEIVDPDGPPEQKTVWEQILGVVLERSSVYGDAFFRVAGAIRREINQPLSGWDASHLSPEEKDVKWREWVARVSPWAFALQGTEGNVVISHDGRVGVLEPGVGQREAGEITRLDAFALYCGDGEARDAAMERLNAELAIPAPEPVDEAGLEPWERELLAGSPNPS